MNAFAVSGPGGGKINLFRQDCLQGLRERLAAESVDVVVTSPPYNIGVAYAAYDDKRPRLDYLAWIGEVGREIRRVLTGDGSFFLNVGGKPSDPWMPFDILGQFRDQFVLQNVIHWIKSIAVGRTGEDQAAATFGHYKPIGGERFLNDCQEYVFHLTKHGRVKLQRLAVGVPYADKSNIGRWKAARQDLRCRGNTWFVPYETIQNRARERPHPSTFPVQLPEMCLKLHGPANIRQVLDPFLGIGTTALACLKLGLSFTGFEIDPQYFEVAVSRVSEFAVAPKTARREYGTL